jgi:hypothetical protein
MHNIIMYSSLIVCIVCVVRMCVIRNNAHNTCTTNANTYALRVVCATMRECERRDARKYTMHNERNASRDAYMHD